MHQRFFFRLKYVDDPSIIDLQQARDADFDGDGIPNWYEVEKEGSDPFDKAGAGGDLDFDGLADGWERFLIDSNPTDATTSLVDVTPGGDFDNDGIKNFDEARYGLSALLDDPATTSGHVQYSYDFDALTGANYQVGAPSAWSHDDNINFLNASE